MILKIICLSIVLIVFFFVMAEIAIDRYKEKRSEKKIKKIGDFTIKEYALLCKKHLKNYCKDCPFSMTNKMSDIGYRHCISDYMFPAWIPFNNIIERKKK